MVGKEYVGQFNCLGKNAEKYIAFLVPIEKEDTRIYEKGKEIIKTISYILQFIYSERFMARLLLNLVFIKLNVYMDTMIKKAKLVELSTKIVTALMNKETLKII